MKKQILFIPILFAILGVSHIFAQETKPIREFGGLDVSPLQSEFVQMKNLKFKSVSEGSDNVTLDDKTEKFLKFVGRLLSKRGSVEVETRSNTIVVTDFKNRVKLISDFVKLIDNSGLTIDELLNEVVLENK